MVVYERRIQIGILALMKTSDTAGLEEKKSKGFHLRIPPDLRKRVDAARKTTGRSLNGEIVALVEAALDIDEPSLMSTVQSLKESVDALNKRLDEK